MQSRVAWIASLVPALLAGPVLAQAPIGGEWRDDVERFAERIVESELAPGLGVAVSKGEWILYADGFGLADADTGRRATADSHFYIASSSKALTATAVVLMAERGAIDLHAPITRYLPTLTLRQPLEADEITVEHLLTMTDGIEQAGPVVVRTAFSGDFTAERLIELLAEYGPSEAGRSFAYRNLPYNILGLALDPADGHGWKRVVEREVLQLLGMHSTSSHLSELDAERVAMPHGPSPAGGWQRIRLAKADANLHAGGGHFTTARDLVRFVAAHATDGRLEGRRIFPAEAIAPTHRPHVEQQREFGQFERFAWGYGWDLARWKGRTIVQRFGGFSGYYSHMSFEPDSGIGVVVLTNGGGISVDAANLMATYIYDRSVGSDDPQADYDRQLAELRVEADEIEVRYAEHLAERAARLAPLSHPLEQFAGSYQNPKLGTIVWQVVAGGLEARLGVAGSRAEVYDAAEDQLRIEIGGGVVADFEFARSSRHLGHDSRRKIRAPRLALDSPVRRPAPRVASETP